MKKIVALVLSLVMALSLATVAFAYDHEETFSTDPAEGKGTEYMYIARDYEAGGSNQLPYLWCAATNKNYAIGDATGTALYNKDGKATITVGKEITDLTMDDITYKYQATTVKAQAWSCTQDQLKDGYKYIDQYKNTVYAEPATDTTPDADIVKLLVDGKIVKAVVYTPVKGTHILCIDKNATDGKVVELGVYEAYCAGCRKTLKYTTYMVNGAGALYDVDETVAQWAQDNKNVAIPQGMKVLTGQFSIVGESATKPADGVESAKTFDAGVAMYVGMSLLSVAGGAVVIGKKKEF